MPTNYSGNPKNVTTPAALTITAITNTVPATVTVSGSLPSDFFTAGLSGPAVVAVSIRDVQGAINANGLFNAQAAGTNTVTLDNTVAPGVYTSGGSMQPVCLSPIFQVPSDGDLDNQASITPLVEALADRSQFLTSRVPAAKLTARWQMTWSDLAGTTAWGVANVTSTANTWFPILVNGSAALTVQGNISEGGSTSIASTSPGFGIDGVTQFDTVRVTLDTLAVAGTGAQTRFGLWAAIVPPGTSRPAFSTSAYALMPVTQQVIFTPSNLSQPLHLDGWLACNTAPGGNEVGTMYVWPAVYTMAVTGAQTWVLEGDTSLVFEVWRQTGVPQ